MNTLRNPTSEALYAIQVLVGLTASVVIAIFSYRAYRETKFRGFLLWIAASILGFGITIGWDAVGHGHHLPQFYPVFVIIYRALSVIHAVISVAGTVLLIQEFRRLFKAQRI